MYFRVVFFFWFLRRIGAHCEKSQQNCAAKKGCDDEIASRDFKNLLKSVFNALR